MSFNAFTVVSEFRFDIANAVLGTEQLKGKVEELSSAVDNSILSVKNLGMSFIANLSGASGGILGLLGAAIKSSDKFTDSQISFTQIIDSNMEHLTGNIGTLNEKMGVSKKILGDIAKDAIHFGLPADTLLQMTKTMTAMLVPKGLAGKNFEGARNLSRNLLKSSGNLGIDPSEVQGQMLRAIEGSASMGDTLFRRLSSEAPEAFKAAGVGTGGKGNNAKQFNALDAAKRFEVLSSAMSKFASNTDILTMRANTLGGMMQKLYNLFSGITSILKPLGDVVMPMLVDMGNYVLDQLNTNGRAIIESIAGFMKGFLKSPREFLLQLSDLSNLAGNIGKSVGITSFIASMALLKEQFVGLQSMPLIGGFLTKIANGYASAMELPIIGGFFRMGKKGFDAIAGMFAPLVAGPAAGGFTKFMYMAGNIGLTIMRMAGLFAVLMIPLTGLSRALDRAKFESLEWIAKNMSALVDSFTVLKDSIFRFFAPISDMIKGWEELFFLMIGGTGVLDYLKLHFSQFSEWMNRLSMSFLDMYAAFRGLIAGMFDVIFRSAENLGIIYENISQGKFLDMFEGTKNIGAGYMQAGAEEFMKTIEKYQNPLANDQNGDVEGKTANTTNNITMNNSFKEVLQPDRIAFTIKDQLEKASRNRGSSVNKSIGATQRRSI